MDLIERQQAIDALDCISGTEEVLRSLPSAPNPQKKCEQCAAEHRQLAAWLKILKKAKFEYDEAWRIITHPTPDVTYADRNRAQIILDTFRNSLGVLDE